GTPVRPGRKAQLARGRAREARQRRARERVRREVALAVVLEMEARVALAFLVRKQPEATSHALRALERIRPRVVHAHFTARERWRRARHGYESSSARGGVQ